MFKPSSVKILSSLFLVLFLSIYVTDYPVKSQPSGPGLFHKKTHEKEEVIRGERLFYGLVYFDEKSINCAGCHNTAFSDTLNWNPDAVEISQKYISKSADDLNRGKEQSRKPGGAIAGIIHLRSELAEFLQVLVFTAQCFYHPHTGDILVVRACNFRIDLPYSTKLSKDLLTELDRDKNDQRNDR